MCFSKNITIFANKVNLLRSIFKANMKTDRINRIKVVLAEQNKTGKWLAEQLQKNEATVSRWCSNTSQPSLEVLTRIAEILNMDRKDLINSSK